MRTIFVQIKCELGRAYEVADDLAESVVGVSEVHSISGNYDLMVKCYLSDEEDIGHYVTERLQRLPGIKDTFTIIARKKTARRMGG